MRKLRVPPKLSLTQSRQGFGCFSWPLRDTAGDKHILLSVAAPSLCSPRKQTRKGKVDPSQCSPQHLDISPRLLQWSKQESGQASSRNFAGAVATVGPGAVGGHSLRRVPQILHGVHGCAHREPMIQLSVLLEPGRKNSRSQVVWQHPSLGPRALAALCRAAATQSLGSKGQKGAWHPHL